MFVGFPAGVGRPAVVRGNKTYTFGRLDYMILPVCVRPRGPGRHPHATTVAWVPGVARDDVAPTVTPADRSAPPALGEATPP